MNSLMTTTQGEAPCGWPSFSTAAEVTLPMMQ
jgi:peptide methionine sulfoxide reductase MsrB